MAYNKVFGFKNDFTDGRYNYALVGIMVKITEGVSALLFKLPDMLPSYLVL